MARQNDRQRAPQADKEFTEQVINIDRVARVVKGGRRFRFRALVVVGDGKGKIGIGVSKGGDVQLAVQKSVDVAKKAFVQIPLVNETIPHESDGRKAGARILIKPAKAGTGIIAGGTMRVVLETAGIKNIVAKSLGSSNKINVAYATLEALQALLPAEEWVTTKNSKSKKTPNEVASKPAVQEVTS